MVRQDFVELTNSSDGPETLPYVFLCPIKGIRHSEHPAQKFILESRFPSRLGSSVGRAED